MKWCVVSMHTDGKWYAQSGLKKTRKDAEKTLAFLRSYHGEVLTASWLVVNAESFAEAIN